MEKIYEAEVTTLAGRNGHAKSSDGLLDVDVSFPKEMGGSGGATNPEQLFAAGYSACCGIGASRATSGPSSGSRMASTRNGCRG